MSYHGDITLEETIDIKFTTVSTAGVPTTLAGSPVVSAYPDNSTTQLTAGITLSVDFDGLTGLHNIRVVATAANGYAAATDYTLVITTGTVGGGSVVGYVVGSFSIENRSALRPSVVGRELVVEADGMAHTDVKEWLGVAPLALSSQRLQVLVGAMAADVLTAAATAADFSIENNAAVLAVIGALADAAADGDPTSSDTLMAYMKQAINTLVGTTGIPVWPASTAPANGVSMAEVLRQLYDEVFGLNGQSIPTATAIADAVWDEDATGHQTQGTFGQAIGDPVADVDTIWGLVNTTIPALIAGVQSDTNDIQTRIPTALVGGRMSSDVEAVSGDTGAADLLELFVETFIRTSGTAQAGGASTITLAAGDGAATDAYTGNFIVIIAGTGIGQVREITANVNGTKVATVSAPWDINPSATSQYVIFAGPDRGTSSAPSAAVIADAVWDEILAGHVGVGSTGEQLAAAGAGGDPWATPVPGAYAAGTAGDALGNVAQTVNDEVLDVLTIDTFSEPASPPTWPMTIFDMLRWFSITGRGINKKIQTVTNLRVRDQADTTNIGTRDTTDGGSEFTEGPWS